MGQLSTTSWKFICVARYQRGMVLMKLTSSDSSFDFQVRSFFSSKDVGAGQLALKQTLEEIQMNIEFRKKYEKKISEWLENNVS